MEKPTILVQFFRSLGSFLYSAQSAQLTFWKLLTTFQLRIFKEISAKYCIDECKSHFYLERNHSILFGLEIDNSERSRDRER